MDPTAQQPAPPTQPATSPEPPVVPQSTPSTPPFQPSEPMPQQPETLPITPTPPPAMPEMPSSSPPPTEPASHPATPLPATHGSSPVLIIGAVALLIVAIIGGVYMYMYMQYKGTSLSKKAAMIQTNTLPLSPTITPVPSTALGSTSTSDTQLNNDVNTVGKSLDSLESDISGIDAGLQDQSVNLQ